jgi:hypothetical protein
MDNASCRFVELRRYALHPNQRETLIELFDREFVETQEAVGMSVLGQFRDIDDPDSFVWLRGFTDMEARKRALEAFYGGPVWKAHADAANATMIDFDNVLLVRPLCALELDPARRAAPGSTTIPPGLVVITTYPLIETVADKFPGFFARDVEPALRDGGISVLASYATEHSENTYPALPIRNDEVFLWITIYEDEADHARHAAALEQAPAWRDQLSRALTARLAGPEEVLRLRPTARSALHGSR